MADQGSTHITNDPDRAESQWSDPAAAPSPSGTAGARDASDQPSGGNPAEDSAQPRRPPVTPDRQETVISKRPPMGQPKAPHSASPLEMGVALEGETLGHFRLETFVGGGGMGAVFRAVDTMLDRTVAVKVLSRDHTDEEILRRFKNEAQSAARLDHDNIARVHYVGEDKGWNYIVFEFVDGLNIRQLVAQKGPLPLEEAINYTLQVAEALEHAFQRDVVHRDIKPSNVLITPEGHVKLVDMGLARLHQVESPQYDLTASGVTLGTFDYISPEQARDPRSADVRSDLYSLGCTFYFMLTGWPPFPEGTVLQKLLSHTSDERPDPRLYRPELPEGVVEILSRMLAKQPQERYQRPSELIGELLLLAEQLGLYGATHGGTVWITPHREPPGWLERLIPVLVPAVGLVLAVLALDYFWPAPAEQTAQRRFSVQLPSSGPTASHGEQPARGPSGRKAGSPATPATQAPADRPAASQTAPPSNHAPAGPKATGDSSPGNPSAEQRAPPGATESRSLEAPGTLGPPLDAGAGIGPPEAEAEFTLVPAAEDAGSGLSVDAQQGERIPPDEVVPDEVREPRELVSLPPRRLIVGEVDAAPTGDSRIVQSLAAACQLAAELPGVEAIELWFNGPREVEPGTLAVSMLTIRAGDGYAPELVFRPPQRDFVSDGRMLRIVGGDVSWEGIHFRLELPSEPSDGWSLFHLDQVVSLALRNCTMTVVNADERGELLQQGVAFFEIQEPQQPDMLTDPDTILVDRQTITLNRCIARGQATLVRAANVTPFTLNWEEGLLLTTERLVETGGAVIKPQWHGHVEIGLQNVTAVIPKGLCLIGARAGAPYQLFLYIDCKNCILLPDPDAPLVEHVGVQGSLELEDRMEFHGRFCFFPDKSIVWRLIPLDQNLKPTVFQIDSEVVNTHWFPQTLPRRITPSMWRRLPRSTRNVHLLTADDYLLDNRPNNPAISSSEGTAGFEPNQLPALPSPPAGQADDQSRPSRPEGVPPSRR